MTVFVQEIPRERQQAERERLGWTGLVWRCGSTHCMLSANLSCCLLVLHLGLLLLLTHSGFHNNANDSSWLLTF